MPRLFLASVALGVLVATSACMGDIGDPSLPDETSPTPEPEVACGTVIEPGPSPIRRMTRFEYNNTVRDLLGDTTRPADTFGAEEEALGFNNNAANLVVSEQLANKYMLAAEGVSDRATDATMMAINVPCDPVAMGADLCAKQFIETFGARAYRRPLRQEEKDGFFALYQAGVAEPEVTEPFRVGIQLVIQAALQSPAFLYRVEMGEAPEGDATYVKLSHFEMASRLSYFLWGTMPDPELFAAAQAGQLGTKGEVEKQARRMLATPGARDGIAEFHKQWLDYDRIGNVTKDAALFPDYSPAIGVMMREEMKAFVEHAVFDGGGTLATLLTAPRSYMAPELATFYGHMAPADTPPGSLAKVDFDPSQRGGLLTLGALMALNAHTNQTSPVHRGKLVREQFLCFLMAPPPPEVDITPPPPTPGQTARDRFAAHSENEGCKGCHQYMDAIGFGFENFDSIGRYRTVEDGTTIDATGTVFESDVPPFTDAVDLVNKLADSQDVQQCYVKQWFRFGYGRSETKADKCTMEALATGFDGEGGDIQELLVGLTQTDAFVYRRAGGTP